MKTKLAFPLPVAVAISIACSSCCRDCPPVPPVQRDVCADYVSLTATLAEETVNCTGTIGPDSFYVNPQGFLQNRFESCTAGPEPERAARMESIKRLLRFQNFGERVPKVRECLTDRYQRWKELFARTQLKTCPTWIPKDVIGDPSREGVESAKATAVQLGKMQPKFRYIPARPANVTPNTPFYVKGANGKGRSVSELQGPSAADGPSPDQRYADIQVPAKTVLLYDIRYDAPEPNCVDPAVCAAQCAAFLPGFVIAAARSQVAADPIQWYRNRVWIKGCPMPDRDDPWCAPDYVHQMSVNSTTGGDVPPGDQYGDPERGKYGEHCLKWFPPTNSQPGYDYETDLVRECTDATETDCLSRCGN